MTYQEFVTNEFLPRTQAILNNLRTNLNIAGVQLGNMTVAEVNPNGDIRWQITATRGNRNFIMYLELTAAGFIDNQMALVITLWIEGNGNQISNSYTLGQPVRYDDEASFPLLMSKLTELEGLAAGEFLTKAKDFLRV